MDDPEGPILCGVCGYDLGGLPDGACPECGSVPRAEARVLEPWPAPVRILKLAGRPTLAAAAVLGGVVAIDPELAEAAILLAFLTAPLAPLLGLAPLCVRCMTEEQDRRWSRGLYLGAAAAHFVLASGLVLLVAAVRS